MKLTIQDRFLMREIMPERGNRLDMILTESILTKIDITAKDIDRYKIKNTESGNIEWARDIDCGEEFSMENSEIEFLKKQVDRLDRESNMTMRIFGLCKKIAEI